MSEHSKFSASASSRWLACPGSVVLSADKPSTSSRYAAEGTVAHMLFEQGIKSGVFACDRGRWIDTDHPVDGHVITIDAAMCDAVDIALGHAWQLTDGADVIESEARVNYARWLEVPEADAFGTLDLSALWIDLRRLLMGDYKHGAGVEVSAVENTQMMLYAGGKLLQLEEMGIEVDEVTLVVFQPRVNPRPSEWSIKTEDLKAWLTSTARSAAASVRTAEQFGDDNEIMLEAFLRPGEKQCRWCPAKATCPALRAEVADTVGLTPTPCSPDEFRDMVVMSDSMRSQAFDERSTKQEAEWISAALSKVDMIEAWCEAVRSEAMRRLQAGESVPGYKLVQGKRGARAWADPAAAEAQLKAMRLKVEEMYDLKLISPPSAEKLAKAKVIGPRQWPKLQALITQPDGKPHVAPLSDPRPAIEIKPVEEMFEAQASADLSQLV